MSQPVKPIQDLEPLLQMLSRGGHEIKLERARQVYANRDVRLSEIEAIGFDMDYTLALYRQHALDALSVEKTLERLVSVKRYPQSILEIEPDPAFAIRGLVIDKEHGNILKLDSGRRVLKAFHGFEELGQLDRYDYARESIRIAPARYHLIDTLFALPEAFLYAALIDHFEVREGGVPISYLQLFEDIRFCIDLAHRDNSLKDAITANIGTYIHRDDRLAPTLHKFRSAGKKLFLMTNSGWHYTHQVMSYLLDGQMAEYASWRQYFDLVITAATKPIFFTGRRPFLTIDDDSGNVTGQATDKLKQSVIYQGGNLNDFARMTGWSSDRTLYIGDHIYGDILKSKKTSSWRTCMIVQEMVDELKHADTVRDQLARVRDLEAELHRLNEQLVYENHMLHRLQRLLPSDGAPPEGIAAGDVPSIIEARDKLASSSDQMKRRRKKVVRQLVDLDREIESNFNPYWGLIFKAGNEHSVFASQVHLYADLYTSAVSNFLAYSPMQYFRAPRAFMPHES